MAVDIATNYFNSDTTNFGFTNIGQLVKVILPNVIVLAGVIFFFLILGGGFAMIKSAGADSNPQAAAKAKNAVTYGIIGFLIVVSSYFILQLVSTATGVNLTDPTI